MGADWRCAENTETELGDHSEHTFREGRLAARRVCGTDMEMAEAWSLLQAAHCPHGKVLC